MILEPLSIFWHKWRDNWIVMSCCWSRWNWSRCLRSCSSCHWFLKLIQWTCLVELFSVIRLNPIFRWRNFFMNRSLLCFKGKHGLSFDIVFILKFKLSSFHFFIHLCLQTFMFLRVDEFVLGIFHLIRESSTCSQFPKIPFVSS